MSFRSDQEWAAAVAARDEAAATALDRAYRPRIEALARKKGIGGDDAKDVAQDVLLDVFRQLGLNRFRGDSQLGTWIFRIAVGKIADHWRSRRSRESLAVAAAASGSNVAAISDTHDAVWVIEALAKMNGADRVVLLLHDRQGRTLKEIGQILNLKTSAVHERLAKARRRFAEIVLGPETQAAQPRLKE